MNSKLGAKILTAAWGRTVLARLRAHREGKALRVDTREASGSGRETEKPGSSQQLDPGHISQRR